MQCKRKLIFKLRSTLSTIKTIEPKFPITLPEISVPFDSTPWMPEILAQRIRPALETVAEPADWDLNCKWYVKICLSPASPLTVTIMLFCEAACLPGLILEINNVTRRWCPPCPELKTAEEQTMALHSLEIEENTGYILTRGNLKLRQLSILILHHPSYIYYR